MVDSTIQIVKSGKLPNSPIQIPFKIPLNVTNSSLFETYHGVDVSIEYSIRDGVNLIFFKKTPTIAVLYSKHKANYANLKIVSQKMPHV